MLEELIFSFISPAIIWVILLTLFIGTLILSFVFLWHWNRYSLRRSSAFLAKVFFFGVTGLIWLGIIILTIIYSSL